MKNEYYEIIKQYLVKNYNQYFIMSKLLNDYEYDFNEDNIDINILHIWFHKNFFAMQFEHSEQMYEYLKNYFNDKKLNYIPEIDYINIEFEYNKIELKIIYKLIDYIIENN